MRAERRNGNSLRVPKNTQPQKEPERIIEKVIEEKIVVVKEPIQDPELVRELFELRAIVDQFKLSYSYLEEKFEDIEYDSSLKSETIQEAEEKLKKQYDDNLALTKQVNRYIDMVIELKELHEKHKTQSEEEIKYYKNLVESLEKVKKEESTVETKKEIEIIEKKIAEIERSGQEAAPPAVQKKIEKKKPIISTKEKVSKEKPPRFRL